MMKNNDHKVARVLPFAAAQALLRAAQTQNSQKNMRARQIAIERVTAKLRREYSSYFKL